MSYMTISSQEKHNFSLCSCFHTHPTTLLLKILGGTNAWAVPPPQIFLGDRPPVSPRSPPLHNTIKIFWIKYNFQSNKDLCYRPKDRVQHNQIEARLFDLHVTGKLSVNWLHWHVWVHEEATNKSQTFKIIHRRTPFILQASIIKQIYLCYTALLNYILVDCTLALLIPALTLSALLVHFGIIDNILDNTLNKQNKPLQILFLLYHGNVSLTKDM